MMKLLKELSVLTFYFLFIFRLNSVVAVYQWQCSAAGDGTGNLPGDVSPSVETLSSMAVTTFTPFMAGILRIYQVPLSVLTSSCSGTVTAIEYCYQFNNTMGVLGRVITFYKLTRDSNSRNFNIQDRFEVWSQPTVNKCHSAVRCCDRFDVPQLSQFSLGDSIFTFGVLTEAISPTTYTLLRFFDNNMYGVNGFQVIVGSAAVSNTTSRLATTTSTQTIPFVRFIIVSPDSSTTTETTPLETTTASESRTTMPPNVVTEPPPTTQANPTTDTSSSPDDSTSQQPTTSGATDPPSTLETTGSSSDDSTTTTPQQHPTSGATDPPRTLETTGSSSDDSTTTTPQQHTTSGATDPPSTLETTGSSPGELAGDRNSLGVAVGAAVGGLSVITVIVLVVIIIVVCKMKRHDKKIVGTRNYEGKECTTTIYSNQEMKDLETDDFQASDVLSPDYTYITEHEVVTNTNEAYITATADMKMRENEAYGRTTSSNETHTAQVVEYDVIESVQTSDSHDEVPSVDYSYVNDDEMIISRDETKETSTQGGMKMSENVAYGHTESSHHGVDEGTYYDAVI